MKLLLCLTLATLGWAQPYDLVLKGGHVIDPKNSVDAVMDVGVRAGRIAAVAPKLEGGNRIFDVSGLYVTPGLVDIHTHLFTTTVIQDAWAGDNSIRPDDFSFRSGVTTMVDAGSSGWRNFEVFRLTVIERAKTRVLAMINIAGLGMLTNIVEQDPADMRPEEVARLARKHKDVVVGVKTAHYEKPDWTAVDKAIEAGKLAGLPVMVDFGYFFAERPFWRLVTERLRPGDIATHVFRGAVPWVDADEHMYDYLRRARERGVRFDVGHGSGSLVFRNAVPATAQGFYPDSISSDLHALSMNAGMMDMPTTISKFLAMGMPAKEAVSRSTWGPAQLIGHPELGHLSVGAVADVAVWNLLEGEFGFLDADGARMDATRRLICELTLKDGAVAWNWNGRGGTDWRKLPRDYGIRKGIDHIVPPPR
jgi:dihydroorotase